MAKRSRTGKQPEFLRFRPYHAFTTAAEPSIDNGRKRVWWVVCAVVMIAVITFVILHGR